MADAMKLVPLEPTEAMVRAGMAQIDWCRDEQVQDKFNPFQKLNQDGTTYTAGTSPGEDVVDAYRAMLAASPPTREEAPAEEAGDAGLANDIAAIIDENADTGPDGLHNASQLAEKIRQYIRNRTSEPEAGEAAERVWFKAGWAARTRAIDAYLMHDVTPDVDAAWHEYEPQGAPVAADVLIDRLQELLDSYAGNTRAYVDVLDFQALINRARGLGHAPATADKLRVAVEALEYIDAGKSIAPVWVQRRVRDALAALDEGGDRG